MGGSVGTQFKTGSLALLCVLLSALATAQEPRPEPFSTGFVDSDGNLFIAQPDTKVRCAKRAATFKSAGSLFTRQGQVAVLESLATPQRMSGWIVDGSKAEAFSERALPLSVAIKRESNNGIETHGPCGYLTAPLQRRGVAITGQEADAQEASLVVARPMRAGQVPVSARVPSEPWQTFSNEVKVDSAQAAAPLTDLPEAWRAWLTHPDVVKAAGGADAPLLRNIAHVFGQPFSATLDPARGAEPLMLIGLISNTGPGAQYNTLWSIARVSSEDNRTRFVPLTLFGPSGGEQRARDESIAPEVALVADLDGDGRDEIVLRARHFEGVSMRILSWQRSKSEERFVQVHRSAYEGQ